MMAFAERVNVAFFDIGRKNPEFRIQKSGWLGSTNVRLRRSFACFLAAVNGELRHIKATQGKNNNHFFIFGGQRGGHDAAHVCGTPSRLSVPDACGRLL